MKNIFFRDVTPCSLVPLKDGILDFTSTIVGEIQIILVAEANKSWSVCIHCFESLMNLSIVSS
jgi:hypothetical protein